MSRHATTHETRHSAMRRCYLIRHAIAEARGDEWPDDTQRPLSSDGVRKMRRAVEGLAALGVELDLIVSSPLLRAVQTADLVANGLPSRPRIITLPALAPGGAPSITAGALRVVGRAQTVAIVGHEPDLGELAAWMLGTASPIPFRKGAVCCLDVDRWPPEPPAHLVWFATPKMLRGL